jgi:hypothetical protein
MQVPSNKDHRALSLTMGSLCMYCFMRYSDLFPNNPCMINAHFAAKLNLKDKQALICVDIVFTAPYKLRVYFKQHEVSNDRLRRQTQFFSDDG